MKSYKYPRTPHLPWSPGVSKDDAKLLKTNQFNNRSVIITEKMDGENTSLYRGQIHARSIDSRHHPSRDWVKRLHGKISHLIPIGWRICGENLYAKHSICYLELKSYFYVFSIWNDRNKCLSWDDTLEWVEMLGLSHVPVLYNGQWNEEKTRNLSLDLEKQEGYVVRTADGFPFSEFSEHIAKWVRKNHVQTDTHWMSQAIEPNSLLISS